MVITKNMRIGAVVALVFVISGAGWWFLRESEPSKQNEENAASLEEGLGALEVGGAVQEGGYTIERLPDAAAEHITVPNLARAVPGTGGDIEGTARVQAVTNLQALSSELTFNGDNFNGWLLLGVYRNLLGDYQGAEEAWHQTRPKA